MGHIRAGHIQVINTEFWNITSLFVFFPLSFPFHCSIVSRAKTVAQSVHRQPSDWVVRVRIPVRTKSFFSTPQCSYWVWSPFSLLPNEYRGWSWWSMKLTTHLHLAPRSRMVELYLHSPIHLHGMMLHHLSMGIILPFHLKWSEGWDS
jgi:hypothetical protein